MTGEPHDNIEIVRSLLRALDDGDFDGVKALLAPDFGKVAATTGKPMSRDEWLVAHEDLHRSFPDLKLHPRGFRAEGDQVTVTVQITARNTAPIRLARLGIEELPATGIELHVPPHTDTFTVHDGKVVDIHTVIPPGGGLPGMLDQIRQAAGKEDSR